MGNTIDINDGLKEYDIQNQHGEIIGCFKINPTDAGMVDRYNKSMKKLEDLKNKYSASDDSIDSFVSMQNDVVAELVYIVGNDSVLDFFKVMGAFSLQNGQFYYEKVLNIIAGIIKKEGNKEKQAMKQRINKYAKRYQ